MAAAVMVTLPPAGTAAGAVYVVAAPDAVCAGVNDPQKAVGVQIQDTPLFPGSLATVAERAAVSPVCIDAGEALMDTAMDGGAVIATVAVALFVVSLNAVAVMVTWPPVGAATGAVYVVAAPEPVRGGANDPQEPLGTQLQVTP
jgi:hypothetical protein